MGQGLHLGQHLGGHGAIHLHQRDGIAALAVAAHVVTSVPNGFVQEVARAFFHGWYQQVADGLPELTAGLIRPSDRPGHGVTLTPELLNASTTRRRTSRAADR